MASTTLHHPNVEFYPPVLYGAERLLAGDVIHEQEAHGSSVEGGGDGPVALLPRCVLEKQIETVTIVILPLR